MKENEREREREREEFTEDDIMDSAAVEDPNNAALSIILAAADNFKDTLVNYDTCAMRRSEVFSSFDKIMCYYKDLYIRR